MSTYVDNWRIPEACVGIIRADITVENSLDRGEWERGHRSENEIRSHRLMGIVDTGAIMMMLPQDVVDELGLLTRRTIWIKYADGRTEERPIAGPLTLTIAGRSMDADCVVGPPGGYVLIGQIELERLDLVANCKERTLQPNPESPTHPLILMLSAA